MQPAVEPHAAERIVQVRGVAGEEDAPAPVRVGDALVHAVDGAHHDLVVARVRADVVQARLQALLRYCVVG